MSFNLQPADQRFVWPESLVVDLVAERYYDLISEADVLRIARRHARFLHHVFLGETAKAAALHKVLLEECAHLGVSAPEINAVNRCAFWEIATLINTRLRPSARAGSPIAEHLHAAVCRLGSMGVAHAF